MPESISFLESIEQLVLSAAVYLLIAFFALLLLGLAAVVVLYIVDVVQMKNAIHRNYPVIGRFRELFEHLGEFFRQYFFAMDREELPFNRAQRLWVDRASKNVDTTVGFGSTKDLRRPGSVLFVNCPYPTLDTEAAGSTEMTIGPHCPQPWTTDSLFNISGMSYGAISRPAVRALSKGAAMAGCWLNTGEGGLSPYHLEGGADIVYQIGTAKNGVRTLDGELDDARLAEAAALPQVRMFELKMSQGAKPGKGSILPGGKVTEEIARIRNIRMGEDAVGPNRHPEINTNSDLLDMIAHIRKVTGKPTGFKAAIGAYGWLDNLCAEILERGEESAPDFITVDGAEGGTGAAPMPLIDEMGLPLRESLPLVVDSLHRHRLAGRVCVVASGKLVTPADVAWALCMGANFVATARGFMFALGCIQALRCNRNTCPTGITTHDKRLQKGLVVESKAERVCNYVVRIRKEVGILAHACGVHHPQELRRFHARVVQENGLSIALNELHPDADPPDGQAAHPFERH